MWRSEAEKSALAEKYNNHGKDVKCPTCGSSLVYKEVGNSDYAACVKCKTHMGRRGI